MDELLLDPTLSSSSTEPVAVMGTTHDQAVATDLAGGLSSSGNMP